MSLKIVPIFKEQLQQGESQSLLFYPEPKHKKMVGMMLTSNTEIAFSLNGGTDLVFNQKSVFHGSQVSPDKRTIQLSEELNGKAMKGVVTGLQNNTNASVYLLIETN